MNSKSLLLAMGTIILIAILIPLLFHLLKEKPISLHQFNENLSAEDIYMGLSEADLIKAWGQGEYIEGFGGHLRKYGEKSVEIGISGDNDNDLYDSISSLQFTNPDFSIYGVKIGELYETAEHKLKQSRFKNENPEYFTHGEWVIILRGSKNVETIQIYFNDKDLLDRSY
ncbi:hypothetical protein FHS15_005200 [Paenibacillus castaneae]|uniref:hypothetical protein n=1 Tax=Paenibacillus castaneae TaxID=474957 RepID=UPI000C9B3E20|nr:hypothetical protein [Paenibacillus castaneae]NIK80016.1 hypothetical protein [Paenibacillus castaneae]